MSKYLLLVALMSLPTVIGHAQEAQPTLAALTEWGDPDLAGVWVIANDAGAPFQRPEPDDDAALIAELIEGGVFERARSDVPGIAEWQRGAIAEWRRTHLRPTSLVVEPADGRIPPVTRDGLDRAARSWRTTWNSDGPWRRPEDLGPDERCISRGPLGSMWPSSDHGAIEIVQAPGIVVIRTEAIHEARIVALASEPGVATASYMGRPRGTWQDGTLVIETDSFNGRTGGRANGNELPTSGKLTVSERFRRVSADTIEYQARISDPGTWERPWVVAFPLRLRRDYPMQEYACHEANAPFIRTLLGSK